VPVLPPPDVMLRWPGLITHCVGQHDADQPGLR